MQWIKISFSKFSMNSLSNLQKSFQSFYVLDLPRGLLFRDIFVDLFPLTGQTFLFLCVTCDLAIVENWTCELIN